MIRPGTARSGQAQVGDVITDSDGQLRIVVQLRSAGPTIEADRAREMTEMKLLVTRDSSLAAVAGYGVATFHERRDRQEAVARMSKPVRRLRPQVRGV